MSQYIDQGIVMSLMWISISSIRRGMGHKIMQGRDLNELTQEGELIITFA